MGPTPKGTVEPIKWYEGRLPFSQKPLSGKQILGRVALVVQATQGTDHYFESQYDVPASELDYFLGLLSYALGGRETEPVKPPHIRYETYHPQPSGSP